MLDVILFVAGFFCVIYGANLLVDGAASISQKFKISNIIIGLTIVSLGTSAPELVVNLIAGFKESADIGMGNILGSNVANVFLILGVSAIIYPIFVNKNTQWKEIPFALFTALILYLVANYSFIKTSDSSVITRIDGVILSLFFIIFLRYISKIINIKDETIINESIKKTFSLKKSILFVLAGIILLIVGGKWVVDGAVEVALLFGIREAVISLTIVAFGTSLPELATCVVAAYKKNPGIIIGNVIGSNIFNILFVLGISAIIKPIPYDKTLNYDLSIGVFSLLLLIAFLIFSKKTKLNKWHGVVFIILYAVYIISLYYYF